MKQAAYDAAIAAREQAPWPSKDEAAAYLTAKGYVDRGLGVWELPWPDHVPTDKQAACLKVLGAKTVKAHKITAEAGKLGTAV